MGGTGVRGWGPPKWAWPPGRWSCPQGGLPTAFLVEDGQKNLRPPSVALKGRSPFSPRGPPSPGGKPTFTTWVTLMIFETELDLPLRPPWPGQTPSLAGRAPPSL